MLILPAPLCALLLLPRRELLTQTFITASAAAAAVATTSPPASAAGSSTPSDINGNGARIIPQTGGTALTLNSVEAAAHFDALGPLAVYPDPILRRSASPVSGFGPAVDKVASLLIGGMTTNSTTALQYAIDGRIIVLKGPASPLSDGTPLVLVNPTVLARSGEDKMVPWTEYCGNIVPGEGEEQLEVELLRDEVVEVAAQDVRGVPVRKSLVGEAARAFQHELDHLDGLLVIDHAGLDELPRDVAERERPFHRSRQRRAFERRTYQGNEPLYR